MATSAGIHVLRDKTATTYITTANFFLCSLCCVVERFDTNHQMNNRKNIPGLKTRKERNAN